jgi:glycosyltransferase involved in cell wall biosynthesis
MPNVVLEALACGCPIVAFDCPHGVSEIVHDGVNGRLLPAEDVAALGAAIVELLRDDELRARLRSGIASVLGSFDASAVSARWNALFRTLTEA